MATELTRAGSQVFRAVTGTLVVVIMTLIEAVSGGILRKPIHTMHGTATCITILVT